MDVQLSDWQTLKKRFEQTKDISVPLSMKKCRPMTVEIECLGQLRKAQFFSDLADAIIDAMDKNGICP